MTKRKGLHGYALALLLVWLLPVSADETAEDVVAMMGWWEEYGQYWDEIGADTNSEDEMTFALLEAKADRPQEVMQ